MKKTVAGVGGLGVGAALIYLFDPERGNRRRALLRDKLSHVAHSTGETLDVRSRDAANRFHGLLARTRSLLTTEPVPDAVLAERVLSREVDALLCEVGRVRGVTGIENKLELHEGPGSVSGLQG